MIWFLTLFFGYVLVIFNILALRIFQNSQLWLQILQISSDLLCFIFFTHFLREKLR